MSEPVSRDALPGKVLAQGKGEGHNRIEMGTGEVGKGIGHRHHQQSRRNHTRGVAHFTTADDRDHLASCSDHGKRKGAYHFGQQPPQLVYHWMLLRAFLITATSTSLPSNATAPRPFSCASL